VSPPRSADTSAYLDLIEFARGGWQVSGYDLDDLKAIGLAEYDEVMAFHRAMKGVVNG
jgi:hypothetical protein